LERGMKLQKDFVLPLAGWYKKKGSYKEAVRLWKQYIAGSSQLSSPEPLIELSKYYEHKEKDMSRALAYAEDALQLMQSRRALERNRKSDKTLIELAELMKRTARLQSRLQKLDADDGYGGSLI